MARRSLPLSELRADCKGLETSVLVNTGTTLEDLAPHRPGSPANPDEGPRGWLYWFGHLRGLHALHAARMTGQAPATSTTTESLITRCAINEPVGVLLSSVLDEHGKPTMVHCYPKSRDALLILHARDLKARGLARGYRLLQQLERPEDLRALPDVAVAWGRQYQQIVWAVTHPSPWLPFDPRKEDPDPPEWLSRISADDTARVFVGFLRVNRDALETLGRLLAGLTPDATDPADPESLGWGGFVIAAAEAEHVAPQIIDRDRSLTELMAQAYSRAKQQKRLHAKEQA